MTTKRVGRLFLYQRANGATCAVNLDAVARVSMVPGGSAFARLLSGDVDDVPAEHGDAFLAALSERAAEVG